MRVRANADGVIEQINDRHSCTLPMLHRTEAQGKRSIRVKCGSKTFYFDVRFVPHNANLRGWLVTGWVFAG